MQASMRRSLVRAGFDLAGLEPREAEALAFIMPLSTDYPGIERWYFAKVVPGLRDGTRKLVRVERGGDLVGLGIGKIEHDERKICTVRVAPSHAGRGIGVRIFDDLLKWLDVDRPHLTVTQHRLPAFERIFDYYGFGMTSVRPGLYVPHTSELGYNEGIDLCADFSEVSPPGCCAAAPRVAAPVPRLVRPTRYQVEVGATLGSQESHRAPR